METEVVYVAEGLTGLLTDVVAVMDAVVVLVALILPEVV